MKLEDYKHLVEAGLVKTRISPCGNMVIVKYARKVFYDHLWSTDPLLLEARGHVFDLNTGEVIVRPFKKVFNLGEEGAGRHLTDHHRVTLVEKVNGFMLSVTKHNGQLVFSTTGSLDSDYVAMGKEYIKNGKDSFIEGFTYNFEICHPNDPHIVEEKPGAYMIGVRDVVTGYQWLEHLLDDHAESMGFLRPEHMECSWRKAKKLIAESKKEGYMIRVTGGGEIIKAKSNHYLTKKFLMRLTDRRVKEMYDNTEVFLKTIDEEFEQIVLDIVSEIPQDVFINMNEAHRRAWMEDKINAQR
ncbi:RNA ligase [Pseudomonas phage EM]|uniref:RNA ligase n=1 Tax=Pseudomonas phage EM TaxID=2936914 RepID=A0AAE9HK63_9CAUD|nr:RNA ligase [Pseudomonas phage EM]UPW35831.1 RNA ligase [Pseudomonas phage EM]